MGNKKRGVSPVIATVLLIVMVIAIALIVFLWFRSFGKEAITKFDGKNIELVCRDDVIFDASYSDNSLYISNEGHSPIYGFKVRITRDKEFEEKEISEIASTWPSTGLNQGDSFQEDLSGSLGTGIKEILLRPVLRGTSESGQQNFVCDENSGKRIIME